MARNQKSVQRTAKARANSRADCSGGYGRSATQERGGRQAISERGGRAGARLNKGEGKQKQRASFKKPSTRLTKGTLVPGRRAVLELLEAAIPLKKAYVANEVDKRDKTFDEIVSKLQQLSCPIEVVTNEFLSQNATRELHQGVMVEMAPYQYSDVQDIINTTAQKENALVVVLDHVTDEGNFGAIVRSAECVGASGVVIANARSASVGTGACKTSAGAVFRMPIAQVSNLATTVDQLKKAGFWVYGSTEHADTLVWESNMKGKIVLIMGSEGDGISRLLLEKCDVKVKLPQCGSIESLNVAQAATVMCYEWLRQSEGC